MKKKLNCVLLVDDDEPTNFLSQMIVQDAACTEDIHVSNSGEKALQYLLDSKEFKEGEHNYPCPDLIFLDVNMPAMNGWEFLEKYNGLEKHHQGNVVIIMLTTSLNPDDKLKSESIPFISGFENKPLTEEKLDSLLRKYFPGNF